MRTILFVTGIVLSLGFAAQGSFAAPETFATPGSAAQGSAPQNTAPVKTSDAKTFTAICENARLRAVERADCHAQMKAAAKDEDRRDVFRLFDVKANGVLADAQ